MRSLRSWLVFAYLLAVSLSASAGEKEFRDAISRQDWATAAKEARVFADAGNATAVEFLGSLYLKGLGVPQDLRMALSYFQRAAAAGLPDSQFILGGMYLKGTGVQQNYPEALKWIRLAADQNRKTAQATLGAIYEEGLGVSRDNAEAMKWYRLAAGQGDTEAQSKLNQLADIENRRIADQETEAAKKLAEEQKRRSANVQQQVQPQAPGAASGIDRLLVPSKPPVKQDTPSSVEDFSRMLIEAASLPDERKVYVAVDELFEKHKQWLERNYPGLRTCRQLQGPHGFLLLAQQLVTMLNSAKPPDNEQRAAFQRGFREFQELCPGDAVKGKALLDDLARRMIPVQQQRVAAIEQRNVEQQDKVRRLADSREQERIAKEKDARVQNAWRQRTPIPTKGIDGTTLVEGLIEDGLPALFEFPAVKGQKFAIAIKPLDSDVKFFVFRPRSSGLLTQRVLPPDPVIVNEKQSTFVAEESGQYVIYANGTPATRYQIQVTVSNTKEATQKLEQERIATEKAQRLAEQERAKQYPFLGKMTCGLGGKQNQHMSIGACVREIELRNGGEYGLYKQFQLQEIGKETREAFLIDLARQFEIRTQNISEYVVLRLQIVDRRTGQSVYDQAVSKYGVLNVKN